MPKKEPEKGFGPNWSMNSVATALLRCNSEWADLWEPTILKPGVDLSIPGRAVREVFFPFEGLVSAMASIVAPGETGPGTEVQVGMYGSDDCANAWSLLTEATCPFRTTVHMGGPGLLVPSVAARRLIEKDAQSRRMIGRYIQGLLTETYQNLACAQRFTSEQRVAAWLLQNSEILKTDALPFSHRYAGDMLGVRRATVTLAVQDLEKMGLIGNQNRGRINILKPEGLQAYAGQCWANMRAHRQALMLDMT